MKRKVEVLISAMNQYDFNIFDTTKITSDALLINQCDRESYEDRVALGSIQRVFSTKDRGLSKSRNKAIDNAKGDICVICDDDEILYDGYVEKISSAYENHPDADIICFKVLLDGKKYKSKEYKIGYLSALKVSSVQVTFKLESIKKNNIKFDIGYGSGTEMGSGEENIFIYDCLKKGLNVYFVPIEIGEVKSSKSVWFKGFNKQYFYKRGAIIRRMMGRFGYIYCLYFALSKYKRYRDEIGMLKALALMNKGMRNNK